MAPSKKRISPSHARINRTSVPPQNNRPYDKDKSEEKLGLFQGKIGCCCLSTLLGGFLVFGMFAVSIVVPLMITLKSFDNQSSTQSTYTTSCIWTKTGVTVLGTSGIPGSNSSQLRSPRGIVLDSSNTLYIADSGNHRIQKLLNGGLYGDTIAGSTNGTFGISSSYLYGPTDVTLQSNGNIYIVDSNNNRIQFWINGLSSGITVAGTGTSGNANNQLNYPIKVIYDSIFDRIFISDTSNHRVMSYASNASSGIVVAGGNGPGTNETQLNAPRGLYFDSSTNSLIIANSGANNIVRWILGQSSWTLVAGNLNGSSGSTSTTLNNPRDVTLDSMGNLYVADTNNHRIQFYLSGQFDGTTIAGSSGIFGNNSTLLNFPVSMKLDNQRNLYVSDTNNHRIQLFNCF